MSYLIIFHYFKFLQISCFSGSQVQTQYITFKLVQLNLTLIINIYLPLIQVNIQQIQQTKKNYDTERKQTQSQSINNQQQPMNQIQTNQNNPKDENSQKPNATQVKKYEKPHNTRYMNQNIYHLFVLNRYQECMQLIDNCKPDEYKLYIKALIYKHEFKLEKSLELLAECEIMNKLNFTYLKNIAKNFFLLGKYKSSLEVAREAYKLNTCDYQIFYIMAKISLAMKDINGAITNLNRSIAKQPNEQSYILLAKLLIEKGQNQQGIDELKKALSISPQNDEIFGMLGETYGKMGNHEQSLNYYEASLQINPNRYESLFAVAALMQVQGSIDKAFQKYTSGYNLVQNSAVFWNNLASVLLQKKKQILAYSCLKKALFLDPFRWDIYTNLGLVLMKVKKYVGAQMYFRSALKLKKHPSLYNLLGICLCELGDLSNAEKCYLEIFNMTKQKQFKINYLCLLIKKGEKDKCREVYREVAQTDLTSLSESQKDKLEEVKGFLQ